MSGTTLVCARVVPAVDRWLMRQSRVVHLHAGASAFSWLFIRKPSDPATARWIEPRTAVSSTLSNLRSGAKIRCGLINASYGKASHTEDRQQETSVFEGSKTLLQAHVQRYSLALQLTARSTLPPSWNPTRKRLTTRPLSSFVCSGRHLPRHTYHIINWL
jgi:hypothetical protein